MFKYQPDVSWPVRKCDFGDFLSYHALTNAAALLERLSPDVIAHRTPPCVWLADDIRWLREDRMADLACARDARVVVLPLPGPTARTAQGGLNQPGLVEIAVSTGPASSAFLRVSSYPRADGCISRRNLGTWLLVDVH